VLVWNQFPETEDRDLRVSRAEMLDLAAEEGLFQGVAGIATGEQNALWTLEADGRTEKTDGAWVTADLFQVLGVEARLGRVSAPEDGVEGRHRVVVLSDGFWRRRFGADSSIVGRTLRIRGVEREVIGVAPPGFDTGWNLAGARSVDYWVARADDPSESRRAWQFVAVARLAPGVDLRVANQRLAALAEGFRDAHPDAYGGRGAYTMTAEPLGERITGEVAGPLRVLMGAVLAILLVACFNVAGLLLVRAEEAERGLAVRSALGASPREVAGPLVAEATLLTAAGAAVGVALAYGAVALFRAANPARLPRIDEVGVDGCVLAFTAAVALGTGLIVALLAGGRAARVQAADVLRSGARGHSGASSGVRLRQALVVGEVAVALALSVAGGLMVRSFVTLASVDPGVRADGVLSMRMDYPTWQFPETPSVLDLHRSVLERVAGVPGVRAAALQHAEHPLRLNGQWYFAAEGAESDPVSTQAMVGIRVVSPDYLDVLGVPLLAGRMFDERDRAGEPLRVLINRTLAERRFPGQDPVGRRLRILNTAREMPPFEIVGVYGDTRNRGLREPPREALLLPFTNPAFAMEWARHMTLQVRTSGPPERLAGPVRAAVATAVPSLVVYDVRTLSDVVADQVATPRLVGGLVGAFAALSLLLAALGIYGITSYGVRRRTRELGVRIALGASAARVRRMVVAQGTRLGLWGLALGLAIAWFANGMLRSALFGVEPTDPLTWAAVSALLLAVVLAASYVPARRASRIEPTEALRTE